MTKKKHFALRRFFLLGNGCWSLLLEESFPISSIEETSPNYYDDYTAEGIVPTFYLLHFAAFRKSETEAQFVWT